MGSPCAILAQGSAVVLTVDCYCLSEFGGGWDKPFIYNQEEEEETLLVRLGLVTKTSDRRVCFVLFFSGSLELCILLSKLLTSEPPSSYSFSKICT